MSETAHIWDAHALELVRAVAPICAKMNRWIDGVAADALARVGRLPTLLGIFVAFERDCIRQESAYAVVLHHQCGSEGRMEALLKGEDLGASERRSRVKSEPT